MQHHYQCYTVYVKETQHKRMADTLVWFPRHMTFPVQSSADAATAAAASALLHALALTSVASIAPVSH